MKLFRNPAKPPEAVLQPLASRFLPTGIPQLDSALGGGFLRGSLTLVVARRGSTGADFRALVTPPTRAALREGTGALLTPSEDETAWNVFDHLRAQIPEAVINARARVVDYTADFSFGPWHAAISRSIGRDQSLRRMVDCEKAVAGDPPRPFLEQGSFGRFATLGGRDLAARMYAAGVPRSLQAGNTSIQWIPESELGAFPRGSYTWSELVIERGPTGRFVRGSTPTFGPIPY